MLPRCRGPGRGDGRPPGGRRRRHPRQDHDHLAADRRAPGRRRATRRTPSAATSPPTGVNAADGTGDLFVAEADESDGAFLVYAPYAAIVTNVEADHLDHWGTEEAYAPPSTSSPTPSTPTASWSAASTTPARPRSPSGSARPAGGWSRCRRASPDALDGVTLWSPGDHYLADALAAFAAGVELGYDADALRARHRVVHRHPSGGWSARARPAGVRVYDSYAHHPTEIAGDLQAARALAGEGRLVVAFQPHLVSRTRIFGAAMGAALGAADEVVVLDVYLAREDADPAVTGALVADAVPLPPERVAFVPTFDDVAAALVARARPGDLVLTLGAGSVTEVGPRRPRAAGRCRPTSQVVERTRRAVRAPAVARRWLAWRYVAGRPCSCCVLVVGAVWLVWFSSWLSVQASTSRAPDR